MRLLDDEVVVARLLLALGHLVAVLGHEVGESETHALGHLGARHATHKLGRGGHCRLR